MKNELRGISNGAGGGRSASQTFNSGDTFPCLKHLPH